jgi:hypothetical protein
MKEICQLTKPTGNKAMIWRHDADTRAPQIWSNETIGSKPMKSNEMFWLAGTSIIVAVVGGVGIVGGHPAELTQSEVSTLHAIFYIATVWIISSLRITRLKALWRVGLGLMGMRGPSGNLLPRGPKARAATGGSASGAGTSGVTLKQASAGGPEPVFDKQDA